MISLTHMDFASIILDMAAVILALCILTQTGFMRRSGRMADKLFFCIMVAAMVMAVSDIGGYLTEDEPDPMLMKIQMLSMTVYYLAATILCMVWYEYCVFKFKHGQKKKIFNIRPVLIPGVALFISVLLNVFFGFIFSIDGTGDYDREDFFILMYIILMFYIVAGFVIIGKYRTEDKREVVPVWLFFMPLLLTTVIAFATGEISMAPLGAATSAAFTHLGTMNEVAEIHVRELDAQ